MFKTILLPVDLGHEASWSKAAPLAKQLLDQDGALHLLSIMPDFGQPLVAGFFPKHFERDALTALREQLDAFAAEHAPVAVTHVACGHVAERILECALRIGADLIVMASHPPDQVRNFLVGSQAANVVRNSPVPVFISR